MVVIDERGEISSTYRGIMQNDLGIRTDVINDIPKSIGMKTSKVLYYVILSGVTTGIGALIGKIIGGISQDVIAVCLSFAAGAMLYIVSGELIPESNKIYEGKASTIGTIIGFILGLIAVNI